MQQNTPDFSSPGTYLAWIIGAIIIALATNADRIISKLRGKKKEAADVHLSEAQTELTEAQTESAKVTTVTSAGDTLIRWLARIDVAEQKVRELQSERDLLVKQNNDLKSVLDLKGIKIGDVMDEMQRLKK